MRVIGLLSGTSIDGIDVAGAELRRYDDVVELMPLGYLELPLRQELRDELVAALPPAESSAAQFCRLDTHLGQAFGQAAQRGVERLAAGRVDLLASLGQTIHHWVEGEKCLGTLQLGQPAWIAEATGLPVISDLRARDVAAGGHGAPLASTLDAWWLRDLSESSGGPTAALNIGGIANITVVDSRADPVAYDTGPGNALLDAAAELVTDGAQSHDTGGRLAVSGTVRHDLLDRLLAEPYYRATAPKSTGKEHFNLDYLTRMLDGLPPVDPPDLLHTLAELTATTIADDVHRHDVRIVLASGGGTRNPVLLDMLRTRLGTVDLRTSEDLGLATEAKEAYLTALLGWLSWHGLPGNVPSATGADGPRTLGSITPGSVPLTLPHPAAGPPPTRLRVVPVTPRDDGG